ncbi:27 kDa hemolymph protein-like [Copidosoma floridanum]|uniref:27 kDa hemolymph protein-like n=1 Tax=Copidosoma floridanum TaxID=29053 RepID=UPI0006C93F17|nr:27 kDa hemolymph protein-like [Copidosoma floridanum]
MKSFFVIVVVFGVFCHGSGQNAPTESDPLSKVNEVINTIQLKDLNITQLPIGEAENALRKKCEKNANAQAYDTAKQAGAQVFDCMKGLVNVTQLKDEMDKARPTGDLDEVFKKYCEKKPVFKKCLLDFTAAVEPCLDMDEREKKQIVHNITEKILNFVCFKEGNRIALFVAAKGPECFQNKAQAIANCANSTYGSFSGGSALPFNPAAGFTGIPEIKEIPSLSFDEKTCRNMNSFQVCVVNALEGCEDPTPANLLDSIFNYIKKVTPCDKFLSS